MTGQKAFLMKVPGRISTSLQKIMLELLALSFVMRDRRVPWRVRLILLFPIVYIILPVDIIPDSFPVIGQLDDLFVVRISYALLKQVMDNEVLADCRLRAEQFLAESRKSRIRSAMIGSVLWIGGGTVLTVYLIKKIRRSGHRI